MGFFQMPELAQFSVRLQLQFFFLLGVAYHLLVSGVLVNGFGGLGGVGYWVVLTILGLFRGLLSWVFSTVQSCFTCCDNSGVYL